MQTLARRIATVFTIAVLVSCGGTEENEQLVPVTAVSAEQRSGLLGDWPLRSETASLIVRDHKEWEAVWQERMAGLADRCGTAYPNTEGFCGAKVPPPIDFSRYTLVGLLLTPLCSFALPTPTRVAMDTRANVLIVEYQYSDTYKTPFYLITDTHFFLVPKTDARLDARPSKV